MGEIKMKKTLLVLSTAAFMALVGCSEEVAEKEVKQVETTDQTKGSEKPAEKKEAPKTMDIEVANNDMVTATLKDISSEEDPAFGKTHKVTYEVENKTDKVIIVQARNVSTDGMMVDEGMIIMSNEIAPGKKANCVLSIESWDETPIPEMKENFEMILYVADNETYETIGEYKVNADLK